MLRLLLAGAARRLDQPLQAGRGRQQARVPGGRGREATPRPRWGAEPQQFSGEVLAKNMDRERQYAPIHFPAKARVEWQGAWCDCVSHSNPRFGKAGGRGWRRRWTTLASAVPKRRGFVGRRWLLRLRDALSEERVATSVSPLRSERSE